MGTAVQQFSINSSSCGSLGFNNRNHHYNTLSMHNNRCIHLCGRACGTRSAFELLRDVIAAGNRAQTHPGSRHRYDKYPPTYQPERKGKALLVLSIVMSKMDAVEQDDTAALTAPLVLCRE